MRTERVRVLVVGHSYVVGVNQDKLARLVDTGAVEIGLLVPDGWWIPDWRRRLPLDPPAPGIRAYPSRVPFEGRGGAYIYPPWTVARALAGFRPHLVHVEQEVFSLSTFEMAVTASLARIPLTVFCWENVDRRLSAARQLTRRMVLRTARWIVAGNQGAADLVRRWGYGGPVSVLPQLGVDVCLFKPVRRVPSNGTFTVGFAGRLVYEKGIDVLLAAVRRLLDRGVDCRLVICGGGPLEADLRSLAEGLGMATMVDWKGAVPSSQVPQAMAQLDVLVLPSRTISTWSEQFGHVLIEAMAMGIPVVGSACGEIPNVIGRSDLIFPENDAAALAEILERLVRQPSWREVIAAYGVERVRDYYTNERVAERLVKIWEQVLERPSRETAYGAGNNGSAPVRAI